jgi:hypothetical protein
MNSGATFDGASFGEASADAFTVLYIPAYARMRAYTRRYQVKGRDYIRCVYI